MFARPVFCTTWLMPDRRGENKGPFKAPQGCHRSSAEQDWWGQEWPWWVAALVCWPILEDVCSWFWVGSLAHYIGADRIREKWFWSVSCRPTVAGSNLHHNFAPYPVCNVFKTACARESCRMTDAATCLHGKVGVDVLLVSKRKDL